MTYSLFKSDRLSANIKLNLYKTLIRSVIIYASPAWEFAVNTYLLKLQRLQTKVLSTIGNYRYCKRLSKFLLFTIILQNYEGNKQKLYKIMKMQISSIQGKENTESLRGLNLAAAKRTILQVSRLPL
jgi:hypothetical protein